MGFRNPPKAPTFVPTAATAQTLDTRASSTAAGVRARTLAASGVQGGYGGYTRGVLELYDGNNPTSPAFLSAMAAVGKFGGITHTARWSDGGHPVNTAQLPAYLEFGYGGTDAAPYSMATLHADQITLDGPLPSAIPRGMVPGGYASSSSPVTGIAAATRLTTCPIGSVALDPSRCYAYFAEARTYASVAGDVSAIAGRLSVTGATPAVTDGALGAATAVCGIAGSADLYPLSVWHLFQVNGSSPTYQVNLWGSRAGGSGVEAIANTAAGDYFHGIIDVGPALASIPPFAI